MKSLSIQKKFPSRRNKIQSVFCFFAAVLAIFFASCGSAEHLLWVSDEDLLALLALNLGGRDVAAVAWETMNLSEKQALRDQAVRIASMARAAEHDGLLDSPDVALPLKWGTNVLLASAWEKKILAEADLSEEALRAFYEANRARYFENPERKEGPIAFEKCKDRIKEDLLQTAIRNGLAKTELAVYTLDEE